MEKTTSSKQTLTTSNIDFVLGIEEEYNRLQREQLANERFEQSCYQAVRKTRIANLVKHTGIEV